MQNIDTYRAYNKNRRAKRAAQALMVIIGLLIAVFVAHTVAYKEAIPKGIKGSVAVDVSKYVQADMLDRQLEMSGYFHKIKARSPQDMAVAVLSTKSPKLLAAMSKIETGGDHTVRAAGYKKRHHGAWQVNPKYWGPVSSNPIKQAMQVEKILMDLVNESNGKITVALNKYGGDSSDNYSKKVLSELEAML
jgi:hypothetical protein